MTENETEDNEPRSASGSGTGESVRPSEIPDAASREEGASVEEIPIGILIDTEEFRRLKSRAERASGEAEEATADEDLTPSRGTKRWNKRKLIIRVVAAIWCQVLPAAAL
jgi:hypothetical protein